MKRYGNLFEQICSFENLYVASHKAQKGKRFKDSTGRFNLDLERNLLDLQEKLVAQEYAMGPYRHFTIYDPKKRLISAAPYEDRVVQHAVSRVLEPIFDRGLIDDCCACRKGKGSHKAVDRFTQFCRRNAFVLKCDIKSYFASIDHDLLCALLARRIKDRRVLQLLAKIIDSTPSPGIPIGNLTSQLFANLYLDKLDHTIKESMRCHCYIRYMDDLILFGNNRDQLGRYKVMIRDALTELKLTLHEGKSQIYRTDSGVPFLGYKVYPTHRLVARQNIRRFRKRIRKYLAGFEKGLFSKARIIASLRSWRGYAIHADSYRLRERLAAEF